MLQSAGAGDSYYDIWIGGYLDIHRYDKTKYGGCGELKEHSFYYKEAIRYAVRRINENKNILQGVPIYTKIFDNCGTVKRIISAMNRLSYHRIMGSVGPMQSDIAVFTSPKAAAFNQLTVSHAATTIEFNDRDRYGTFFRTGPSEEDEVLAIIDIIRHFNWTYVSVVNSYGYNGQESSELFVSKLKGICIATRVALSRKPTRQHYENAISKLLANEKATVVIILSSVEDTRLLLHAAEADHRARLQLTWISGTKFMAYKGFVDGIEQAAKGALMLSYSNMSVPDFDAYVDRHAENYSRHFWLNELMSKVLNCSLSAYVARSKGMRLCSGKEKLENGLSHRYRFVATKAVISAVQTIACGVRKYLEKHCFPKNLTTGACKALLLQFGMKDPRFDIVRFFQNQNTTCGMLPHSVNFDRHGSVPRPFDILNFDGREFQKVGQWQRRHGTNAGFIKYYTKPAIQWTSSNQSTVSRCSSPCKVNEIKIADILHPQCCFSCKPCSNNSIITNNSCIRCLYHQKANDQRDQCIDLPILHLSYANTLPVIIITGMTLGLMLTTFIFTSFIKNINSQVVKASSREISFIILTSFYALFGTSILFIIEPTFGTCALRRIIVGVGLTTCYGALLLKTNRIYRIFEAAKSARTPILVSTKSQITICLLFLDLQVLLSTAWILADPPLVMPTRSPDGDHVFLTCKSNRFNFLLNLLPCSIFMLQCTFYAYKTRRFPENFNEASSIGLTMYANCLMWVSFVSVKLWLDSHNREIQESELVVGIFCNAVSTVNVVGLFGPKLIRIFFGQRETGTMRFFLSSQVSTVSTADTGI